MKVLFRLGAKALGDGPVLFEWRPKGNHVAVAGSSSSLRILNRSGQAVEELQCQGTVTLLAWDKDGEVLAFANDTTSAIGIWNFNSKQIEYVESSMGSKEKATYLEWSPTKPILAVGNSKGNLLLYNRETLRKVPLLGKHQKAIVCGAFSRDGEFLILGSDDHTLSISNMAGDTLNSLSGTGDLSNLDMVRTSGAAEPTSGNPEDAYTITVLINKKQMMMVHLANADAPINLQFHDSYGKVVTYEWLTEDRMMIGFEMGHLICVNTTMNDNQVAEVFTAKDFKRTLWDMSISSALDRVLTVGDNQMKAREISNLEDVSNLFEIGADDPQYCKVRASDDGNLMAIAGSAGSFLVYLTRMPVLGAAYGGTIVVLSSLQEITVYNGADLKPPVTFETRVEPSLIAVGPLHVVVVLNNYAWFYELGKGSSKDGVRLAYEYEYVSTVTSFVIGQFFVVAKMDDRAQLHRIRNAQGRYVSDSTSNSRMFPESNQQQHSSTAKLTDFGLTNQFFIYATDAGHIQYFSLDEWVMVNEYRHSKGIRAIFPEPNGVRLIFFDEKHDVYLYSPIDDHLSALPNLYNTPLFKGCLWESFTVDKDTFIVFDETNIYVFLISGDQLSGEFVQHLGLTRLPYGYQPLLLNKGIVHCLTSSGRPTDLVLETHKSDSMLEGKSPAALQSLLKQNLTLKREFEVGRAVGVVRVEVPRGGIEGIAMFWAGATPLPANGRWKDAWRICEFTKIHENWRQFGFAAMMDLEIELALRVFRHMGDVSMVMSLEEIVWIEEKALLSGHLAMVTQQFDKAEEYFLQSTEPTLALEMRRDLLHWDKALELASRLAPDQIVYISKEYAQQLEFTGEYAKALSFYERGLIMEFDEDDVEILEHNEICSSGVAKMSIRTGNIRKGMEMAAEIPGRVVKRDCAQILEQMKQFNDAAHLYEIGMFYDRAAAASLKAKNWAKVGELLPNVRSPKIHAQYGKVMEHEKKYKAAALAYKHAKDYDNLVRVLLDHLNLPEEAVKVVRESRSVEGAKWVAKFFSKIGDHSSAIQFLVLSHCHQEAFHLAEAENKMEVYSECIEEDGTVEQFKQLAEWFSNRKQSKLAGKFHMKAKNHRTAMDFLLLNGEDDEAMQLAIECASEANDPQLAERLTEFLMGELDGVPKDPRFLFRFYVSMKMYPSAAKTATIIAREEQSRGNYRIARDLLFTMTQELKQQKIRIPAEMVNNLMLIHSYLIVKMHIKRNDQNTAARLLIRVADNISRFPSHTVPILTSTVITCSKAGLRQSAFNYAVMLLRPENRKKIDEKYRKRIEAIVRKQERTGGEVDNKSLCPHCDQPTAEFDLTCGECKNIIPYCVVTGRHIVAEDFCLCPSCSFPAIRSEFNKLVDSNENCPMCGKPAGNVSYADAKEYLYAVAQLNSQPDEPF